MGSAGNEGWAIFFNSLPEGHQIALLLGLYVFIYLFGSRTSAFEKDFFYFDTAFKLKRWLYIVKIPVGDIAFNSLALQILTLITFVISVLTLIGINFLVLLYYVLGVFLELELHKFARLDSRLQQMFFYFFIWFISVGLLAFYSLICSVFSSKDFK